MRTAADDPKGGGGVAGRDDEAVGNEPTLDDALPLQPVRPVRLDDVLDQLDPQQAQEMLRQQENLQRRLADQELLDALAGEDFTGRRYRRFEEALAAYGISVLRGWMQTGYVFTLTAGRGFHLKPSEYELTELAQQSDVREELANMTVALTLPRFREQALLAGGWRVDGGASVPTYFMGATLYVFPNQFRQHRAYQRRYHNAARSEGVVMEPLASPVGDPAAIALGDIRIQDELRGLDSRTAAVVTLHLLGYSQEETAELLDLPSTRTVEGILYRWRTKAKARAGEGRRG